MASPVTAYAHVYDRDHSDSFDGERPGPASRAAKADAASSQRTHSFQMQREQQKLAAQYQQYKEWRAQRSTQHTAPQLLVQVGDAVSGDNERDDHYASSPPVSVAFPAEEEGVEEGEYGRAPGKGASVGAATAGLVSQFSILSGDGENPRPVAFGENAEAGLPVDDSTKWYYKEEAVGPWDWWKHRVLPWVSDEVRREVKHMEDFLVRCVVADHASEYAPNEAHAVVTQVLRHAAHELFRRVPVLRLGTARALEAAQKRATSLQIDLVNAMSLLETLRLSQRRRTRVCFSLWRMGMQRRKGMEAISTAYISILLKKARKKAYYLWRNECASRKTSRKVAMRVVQNMLGRGALLKYWLKWRQMVLDSIHEHNAVLTGKTVDLTGKLDDVNRQLRKSKEETKVERARAEGEKKRADSESAQAWRLKTDLAAAERRIGELEALLERTRLAADDTSAASIVASARSMLGRCTFASSRLRVLASAHTPDPRALLTREESAAHGDDGGCDAVQEMHPAQILLRFINRCRELSWRRMLRTPAGGAMGQTLMTAAAHEKATASLEEPVSDLKHVNQTHLTAVLETVGLVSQGTGMTRKRETVSRTVSKRIVRLQAPKGNRIELPEDMWASADAAQKLLEAVEAAAGWPPGVVAAEELVGGEPGAMAVLISYVFMHFPGEWTMRGAWQDDASAMWARAEELEKKLAEAAAEDPTGGAGAASPSAIAGCSEEIAALETMVAEATRQHELARRAFVDVVRVVDSLAVQVQEARHGDRTVVMVTLGDSELSMFTELRMTKIRELFRSDEESAAALDSMRELFKSNFALLKNVYKHYAPNGSMNNLNFWSMVRDCNLEDDSLTAAQLDIIFTRADLDDDMGRSNILEPQDFVEALVRIASVQAQVHKGSSDVSAEEVTGALQRLLEETVATKAGKSEADVFRAMLEQPAMRNVFRTNRDNLRLIFARYAAADLSAGVNKKMTMNIKVCNVFTRPRPASGRSITCSECECV